MKILLLVSAFNSQVQALYTTLEDRGEEVAVVFALNELQSLGEIEDFEPELILCPYLETDLPASIYTHYPTYIFYAAPRGERGSSPLEYALQNVDKVWGLVILRANASYLGGDIYAEVTFKVRETSKSSLFRHEVVDASLRALEILLENIISDTKVPQLQSTIHEEFSFRQRAINWQKDDTQTIIDKINLSDSHPGTPDEILGVMCFIYGAHKEDKLRGAPKEILAKRDGALCLGTIDGSVWISHVKEIGQYTLPASHVLREKLKNIQEDPLPLQFDNSYATFHEISVEMKERVAYLSFNFRNGAMDTQQCLKLKSAIEEIITQCDVLVLMGGADYFSNGIHLNKIEDATNPSEYAWENNHAMVELVSSLLYADDVVTIASLQNNAAAGGLFMGLACDYVVAQENVVLNPHFKTLGLSGGAYHTYSLAKRVGEQKTHEILNACLPLSIKKAKVLGMVDAVFNRAHYDELLHTFAKSKYSETFIENKKQKINKDIKSIEASKKRELEVMHPQVWDKESDFHTLRRAFVYKERFSETPKRFKIIR